MAARTVTFSVELDDQGVVRGIDSIKSTFSKAEAQGNRTTESTNSLGKSLKRVQEESKKAGEAGVKNIGEIGEQTHKAREATEILSKTLGVEVPSSLQKILAKTPAVSGALAALFRVSAVVAMGAAVVTLVNNFDEVSNSIRKGGVELLKFDEHLNEITSGKRSNLLEGLTILDAAKLVAPVTEAARSAGLAAQAAGLEGYAAIAKARDQDIANAKHAKDILLQQIREEKGDEAKVTIEAEKQLDQQIEEFRKNSEAKANKLLQQMRRQHLKALRDLESQRNQAALRGTDVLYEQERHDVVEINKDPATSSDEKQQARVLREDLTVRQILRMEEDFQRQMEQISNQAVADSSAGLTQIDAQVKNQILDLQRTFNDDFSGLAEKMPQEFERMRGFLGTAIGSIKAKAAQLGGSFTNEFLRGTQQLQSETEVLLVAPWERGLAQIQADYQQTLMEIEHLRMLDADHAQMYDARIVSLERRKNAQIIDENRQLVEQMGQDLQSVFDSGKSIGQQILANAKKLFFQIMAQWFLVARGQGGGGGALGGLLGSLIFGPGNSTGQVVFGGGGGGVATAGAGGIGSLLGLGGGFGVPSSTVGGTYGGGSLGGGAFSLSPGGGASGPGAGTSSTPGSAGGSLASVAQIAGVPGLSLPPLRSSGGGGILGGGAKLTQIGALLAPLLGSKFGGTLGGVGGGIAALYVSALAGNPAAIQLLAAMPTPLFAGLGFAAGGLIGFGVGSQHGKLAGSIAGGLSGAGIGTIIGLATSLGGPVGAIVGAIIGLLGGIFGGIFGGGKRKKAANSFVDQQVLPQIHQIEDQFFSHQLDFATANQDLLDLKKNAQDQLKSLKGEGKDIFKSRVIPAIDDAMSKLQGTENERERRLGLQAIFGPPQFHSGGYVSPGYTVHPGELLAKLRVGEYVVNPQATAKNREALEAMNNGADIGGDTHVHIHAWDAASVDAWLKNGGARKIKQHLQRERSQYAS
jgi:hypothetical protein